MGKQINYWLGYEDFLKIAQVALDCGCIIIKKVSGKLIFKQTLDIVTEHEYSYWFYVPEAGVLSLETFHVNGNDIQYFSPADENTIIEAGFSFINDKNKIKTITRSRLYVISGYYDEQGDYIPRPECVTKIYNKLVRIVKKVAPFTELTDKYVSENDNAEVEWKHKEYITPEYLHLKESNNYKLIG